MLSPGTTVLQKGRDNLEQSSKRSWEMIKLLRLGELWLHSRKQVHRV